MVGFTVQLRGIYRAEKRLAALRRRAADRAVRDAMRPAVTELLKRARQRARQRLASAGVSVPARAIRTRRRNIPGGFRVTMFPARQWFYLRFLHIGPGERYTEDRSAAGRLLRTRRFLRRKGRRRGYRGRVRARPWMGFERQDAERAGESALARIRDAWREAVNGR
ncbi:MAG: hypothetical protein OXF57_00420 [Rhodospirillaceae bacterium]|nr:hypothetical protein [Rhodospirillaceae bacterium]